MREPWQLALAEGEVDAAWDRFIGRYRRLILATIRRTLGADDDVPDVFADVCQALSADGLARLRRYGGPAERTTLFSTCLVVVVRNRAIDWVRSASGRRRSSAPPGLTALQEEIYRRVFSDRRSHAEAYEMLRTGPAPGLSYGTFLRELTATYRTVERRGGVRALVRNLSPGSPFPDLSAAPPADDALLSAETGARVADILAAAQADVRLAIQLFVIEELPAADVARVLGWPNAKAVYNRVYRALADLRRGLERQGVGRDDL